MNDTGEIGGGEPPRPEAAIPRLTRNGYERRPETEVDIRALLGLRGAALLDGFCESRPDAPAYRRTEALIFFLRRAWAEGDERTLSGLFGRLFERCRPFLRDQVRGFDEHEREDILADIYEEMTRLLLRDDDSSDFLQRSFWQYLKRRTVTAVANARKRQGRTQLLDDRAAEEDEGTRSRIDAIRDHDLSPEDRALLQDGLAVLPFELRELFVLRHMEAWRVGDERRAETGSGDPTLAEKYGISPRAVRKRLAKAEELLERYRKDSA
jgi:DNA-directed RNA polymerase specialized sigma24 family protein